MREIRHNSGSSAAAEHLLLLDENRFAWAALERLKPADRSARPSRTHEGQLAYL